MATHVVIGVPTFRRPQWLERCLRSLAALNVDQPIKIVVADNDAEKREGLAVCEQLIAEGFPHPLTAVLTQERGITWARNLLVSEALRDPDVRFIAMLDDDEWAEPDWLSELLSAQAEFDADVVGGPVERIFESAVPDYVAKANQPDFKRMLTGPIDFVDATSNILFRAQLFRDKSEPWFDVQYALMGGEDKDILLGFKMSGRTFAWACRAVVTEEMPTSRCSAKWMIQRAYRVGNSDTVVNLKHRPPGFTVVSESAKIVGALALAALKVSVFAWDPGKRFEGMRLGARVLGKLSALTGGRHEEYKVIHGR